MLFPRWGFFSTCDLAVIDAVLAIKLLYIVAHLFSNEPKVDMNLFHELLSWFRKKKNEVDIFNKKGVIWYRIKQNMKVENLHTCL